MLYLKNKPRKYESNSHKNGLHEKIALASDHSISSDFRLQKLRYREHDTMSDVRMAGSIQLAKGDSEGMLCTLQAYRRALGGSRIEGMQHSP